MSHFQIISETEISSAEQPQKSALQWPGASTIPLRRHEAYTRRIMIPKRRARSADDKAEKRGDILAAAGKLIVEREYRDITMADIACQAKVAKGTLFIYFKSKEELFLAVTAGYLKTLFVELEAAVADAAVAGSEAEKSKAILSAMTGQLAGNPGLLRMIVLLGPILEHNVGYQRILELKRFMLDRMTILGAGLERAFPGMRAGAGMSFLQRLFGIAVGYLNLENPAACVKYVIENEDLAAFRFDFRSEFEETAAILLKGMM
jgi:TetR/AcrR family transcriptional regulator